MDKLEEWIDGVLCICVILSLAFMVAAITYAFDYGFNAIVP